MKPVAKLLGVGAALVPIEKVHTVAVLSPEGKEALGGFTPSLQGGLERNLARFGGLGGEKRGWRLAECQHTDFVAGNQKPRKRGSGRVKKKGACARREYLTRFGIGG